MKKIFMAAMMAVAALAASAQNIQIHYDFGKHIYSEKESNRQDVTVTYETFKADKLGSWYYFVDVDVNRDGTIGAYTELSREFTFKKLCDASSLAAHAEFDGGLSSSGGVFQSAMLIGPAWNWHNADFSKTLSVQALYKQFFGQKGRNHGYASFQLTGVWGLNFCNNWTFSGFFDLWRGEKANNHGCLVFLTEPQLWYNINKTISVGTEVEMSNNFIFQAIAPFSNNKFYINPTLAVKFNL